MPMLLDKKWFYKIYGLTGALIFGYLFIAVFVSNVSGIQQSNMDPVINYIIGYSFGIIGFLASAMLVYVGFYKDEITGELKMSEVQAN